MHEIVRNNVKRIENRGVVMGDYIAEALLEMHFHAALVKYFSRQYGARALRVFKPSPQKEAWLGFDQAWVKTSMDDRQLESEIKQAIRSGSTSINRFYLGYFLQFKKVEVKSRSSRYTPSTIIAPYLRSEIDLQPNRHTGLSQHETLQILSRVHNTSVHYACGMLFNTMDIYSKPDIRKLRMVPISSAPQNMLNNERHFLIFRKEDDPSPLWCSEPKEGLAYSCKDWILGKYNHKPMMLHGEQAIDFIKNVRGILKESSEAKIRELEEKQKIEELRQTEEWAQKRLQDNIWERHKIVARLPEKRDLPAEEGGVELPREWENIMPASLTLIEFESI